MTELEKMKVELEMTKIELRNAQQETLRVKSELRTMTHLWIETFEDYKNIQCSEDNYNSLKIILKRLVKAIKKVSGE